MNECMGGTHGGIGMELYSREHKESSDWVPFLQGRKGNLTLEF